jgi:hypothetical protein
MKIMICLPGDQFSSGFLKCLIDLIKYFNKREIEWDISAEYSSNIFFSRNKVMKIDPGGENRSRMTKPFNGKKYDYMLWIDADAIFTPDDFKKLLRKNKDIISGITYSDILIGKLSCGRIQEDGRQIPVMEKTFDALPRNKQGLLEMDYTGFHFILIKNGVMEKVKYPWFFPTTVKVNSNMFFPSEDLGWCMRARNRGFKIYIHPEVSLGHEKLMVQKIAEIRPSMS